MTLPLSRRGSVDGGTAHTHHHGALASIAVGGAKTIGLIGGVSLLINNITGSGMVLLSGLNQAAGWLPVTLVLLAISLLSWLCSIMVIESMAAMPGNGRFEKRVEYTSLAYFYLGRRGYLFTQFFFQMSLACNNMSGIIQSVQVMDFAISAIFNKDCGLQFYPHFHFFCMKPVEGSITPFGPSIYLLSIGFIATALFCLPLGYWNLDDNIVVQKVSCFLVFAVVFVWVGLFGHWGLEAARVPVIGTELTNLLGVCVFNYAIITSIPSWVNEKREDVSIHRVMGLSMSLALGLFILIGVIGGMAFPPWFKDSDQTLLNKLQDSGNVLAHITFYLFPVVVNMTSIPVFAIMQRYNLIEAGVCGPKMAGFLGVVLPWLVCIPFYTGQGFSNVVNWGGIIFNSVVNFIVPPLIYIRMVQLQSKRMHLSPSKLHLADVHHDALSSPGMQLTLDSTAAEATPAAALLGAHDSNSARAGLNQSLLSAPSSTSHAPHYHSSELGLRTAEEEAQDQSVLGYDPYATAVEEEEEVNVSTLHEVHSLHNLARDTLALPINQTNGGSGANDAAVLGVADGHYLSRAHSFTLAHEGWTGLPKSWRPWRIHIAAAVAALLALIALAVIGINIHECVTDECAG